MSRSTGFNRFVLASFGQCLSTDKRRFIETTSQSSNRFDSTTPLNRSKHGPSNSPLVVVGCCWLLLVVVGCWLLLVVVSCCWLFLLASCSPVPEERRFVSFFGVVTKAKCQVHARPIIVGPFQ